MSTNKSMQADRFARIKHMNEVTAKRQSEAKKEKLVNSSSNTSKVNYRGIAKKEADTYKIINKKESWRFTNYNDFFRSPYVSKMTKIVMFILKAKNPAFNGLKDFFAASSTIAKALNKIGVYEYDENGNQLFVDGDKKSPVINNEYYTVEGIKSDLRRLTGTYKKKTDASGEVHLIIARHHHLKSNPYCKKDKDTDPMNQYLYGRTLEIDYDQLREFMSCCSKDSKAWKKYKDQSLAHLIMSELPFDCLEDAQDDFNQMSNEVRQKYRTVKRMREYWIKNVTAAHMKTSFEDLRTTSFENKQKKILAYDPPSEELVKTSAAARFYEMMDRNTGEVVTE